MQRIESNESENLVQVECVVEVEVKSRSEAADIPILGANMISLCVRCQVSEPIKVVSPQGLLEESLHVAWSQACLELRTVIDHFEIDIGKV